MLKDEFEALVANYKELDHVNIDPEEYKIIEYVYTYHPSDPSKYQVAVLYGTMGFNFIKNMLDDAKKCEEQELLITKLKAKLEMEKDVLHKMKEAWA